MNKLTLRLLILLVSLVFGTLLSAQMNVTFNVYMTDASEFDPSIDTIYISGSFAGWPIPGTNPFLKMIPSESNELIYTLTTPVSVSAEIEYKYFRVINDTASWNNGEWDGDPNRIIRVKEDSMEFNNVWGNKPHYVTFNVDMTPALDSAVFDPAVDQVFIAGDFAGWAMPGTIPELALAASDDNIYSLPILMYNGDYEYKYFVVHDGTPSMDFGEWDGDPNRMITIDTTVNVVNDIWALLTGFSNYLQPTYTVFPNPVQNTLFIKNLEKTDRIEIYNMVGQKVKTIENISTPDVNINATELNNGVYFISVYTAKGVQTTKFVKK